MYIEINKHISGRNNPIRPRILPFLHLPTTVYQNVTHIVSSTFFSKHNSPYAAMDNETKIDTHEMLKEPDWYEYPDEQHTLFLQAGAGAGEDHHETIQITSKSCKNRFQQPISRLLLATSIAMVVAGLLHSPSASTCIRRMNGWCTNPV